MSGGIYYDIGGLADELRMRRSGGNTPVQANGCFDILHAGHLRYLRGAASLGAILVAALNGDRSTALLKGEGRPLISQDERTEILSALKPFDYVLVFGNETVDGVIRILRLDFRAKGTDYEVETVPEIETARAVGCRTVIAGDPKDNSSRKIIARIRGEGGCGS